MERDAALDLLPPVYAQALRLRDEGRDSAAIAAQLDVEPDAVGTLLRLADSKLAHVLETHQ